MNPRVWSAQFAVVLIATITSAYGSNKPPQPSKTMAPPQSSSASAPAWNLDLGHEERVDIGLIHNAPNGHISFQNANGKLTLWVAGRIDTYSLGALAKPNPNPLPITKSGTIEGAFFLEPKSWSKADLEGAHPTPTQIKPPRNPADTCNQASGFYRDYAAINAIIPGSTPGELLAFVDGEYHPGKDSGSSHPGNPLLASIGLATSTNGVNWTMQGQVIQGLDEANYVSGTTTGCLAVLPTMKNKMDNEGAAGPSAVVRTEGNTKYVYVYYEDRVRLTPPGASPSSEIYLARAPLSNASTKDAWQRWTGSCWSPGQKCQGLAAPIVKPSRGTAKGDGEAAQPQVTFNSALNAWLMVFHTHQALYVTQSPDGIKWDTPVALPDTAAQQGDRSPTFPTLLTQSETDQQTTGGDGWLFYSRHEGKSYVGYRRTFTVPILPKPPACHTPKQCCDLNGGTWSGGRCH